MITFKRITKEQLGSDYLKLESNPSFIDELLESPDVSGYFKYHGEYDENKILKNAIGEPLLYICFKQNNTWYYNDITELHKLTIKNQ